MLSSSSGRRCIIISPFVRGPCSSDPNWWKGSNHRGEGLFPANFVSADLEEAGQPPEPQAPAPQEEAPPAEPLRVDPAQIDDTLQRLHETDPASGQPDPPDLLALEERCAGMGPLIEQELERIDRRHASLTAASRQLADALALYHGLMRTPAPAPGPPPMVYGVPSEGNHDPASLPAQFPGAPGVPPQQGVPQGATGSPVGFPLL
ncbi:unnamed protein product [Ixodes hexagonus]